MDSSTASGSNDLLIPFSVAGHPFTINVPNLILIFMSILLEAMPFIVLGAVVAGLLEELLPQKLITRILPRSRFLAIAIGGLLGLLFPMCECGIIPVMRRLLRKGLPLSCCTAYLLAGPIINVVVMLSTFLAFRGPGKDARAAGHADLAPQMGGLWMMGLRMGLGYLVAIGTSLIVEWQYRKHGNKLLTPLAAPSDLPLLDEDDAGEEAADRRAHHEHRADESARLRGHHGLPDPRRPDRLADAAADLAGNGGQAVQRVSRAWPSA